MSDYDEIDYHLAQAGSAAGSQMAHLREAREALDRLMADSAQTHTPTPSPSPEPDGRETLAQSNGAPTGPVTQQSLRTLWGGRGITTPIGDVEGNTEWLPNGHRQVHSAGRNGPGVNYGVNLPDGDAAHVIGEWTVEFEPGFSFGSALLGGKMGGFGIGKTVVGGNGTDEKLALGGSLRLTWHGTAETSRRHVGPVCFRPYAYHRGQSSKYGDGEVTDISVPIGSPIRVRMEVDVRRGWGRIWANGSLVSEKLYDWPDGLKVSRFLTHIYHGGGTNEWGPTTNCHSRITEVDIWRVT